jgi:O-antigen/teichoic acid export membrane protein
VSISSINMCSFLKNIILRLAVPVLSRLQDDKKRLTQVINEGMHIQTIVLGPVLVSFIMVSPWLIPRLYGDNWLPVLLVLPFLAWGSLVNGFFGLHVSALYVLHYNWQVAVANFLHVLIFAGSAIILIPLFKINGYGLAELAATTSYLSVHLLVKRYVGKVDCAKSALWFFSCGLALLGYLISWFLLFLVFLPLLRKDCRRELRSLVKMTLCSFKSVHTAP